jgi:hypothetical protein
VTRTSRRFRQRFRTGRDRHFPLAAHPRTIRSGDEQQLRSFSTSGALSRVRAVQAVAFLPRDYSEVDTARAMLTISYLAPDDDATTGRNPVSRH